MRKKRDRTIETSWARLYRHAKRNDISFFAGAGLSIACKFPQWEELTRRVWELCKPQLWIHDFKSDELADRLTALSRVLAQ